LQNELRIAVEMQVVVTTPLRNVRQAQPRVHRKDDDRITISRPIFLSWRDCDLPVTLVAAWSEKKTHFCFCSTAGTSFAWAIR